MEKDDFVKIIIKEVVELGEALLQQTLNSPSGRNPEKSLLYISNWYKKLSDEDKKLVLKCAKLNSWFACFKILSIFDGVSAVEGGGELSITWEKDGNAVRLNKDIGLYLHEILASEAAIPSIIDAQI